jgi:hypothetical protein
VNRFREPTAAENAAAERRDRAQALELHLRMAEARAIAACAVAVTKLATALVEAADQISGAPPLDQHILVQRVMVDVSAAIEVEASEQIEAICDALEESANA